MELNYMPRNRRDLIAHFYDSPTQMPTYYFLDSFTSSLLSLNPRYINIFVYTYKYIYIYIYKFRFMMKYKTKGY